MNRDWLIDLINTEIGLAEGQNPAQLSGPRYEQLCRSRGITEQETWRWERILEYQISEAYASKLADAQTMAFLRNDTAVCEFLKALVSKWRRGRPGPVPRLPWES